MDACGQGLPPVEASSLSHYGVFKPLLTGVAGASERHCRTTKTADKAEVAKAEAL